MLFFPISSAILSNTSLEQALGNPIILTNIFQRITGLLAFTLLFMQIMIGAHMNRWVQIIGAKAYKIHITQGLVSYGFMLIHPLFESAIVYQVSRSLTEAILTLKPSIATQRDLLLTFGRTSFVLVTIAVIASYFRTKPFFRRNWRAFHILNYLAFFLVFFHARVGTDTFTPPFLYVYWLATTLVSGTLIYKVFSPIIARLVFKFKVTDKAQEKA